MTKKIIVILCISFVVSGILITIVGLASGKTHYTQGMILLKDKKTLILDSEVIIKGKVVKVLPSEWLYPEKDKNSNTVYTDVEVTIENILKGTPYNNEVIKVRSFDNGKIGNTKFISEGIPEYIEGESVILFLSDKSGINVTDENGKFLFPNEDYYVLTGMKQGKFTKLSGEEEYVAEVERLSNITEKDLKNLIEEVMEEERINPRVTPTREEVRKQNEKVFGK